MEKKTLQHDTLQQEEMQQTTKPQRKQFHGFSMGFLLILLALVVGIYIACTVIAAGDAENKSTDDTTAWKLEVSPNNRYLQYADGRPFSIWATPDGCCPRS